MEKSKIKKIGNSWYIKIPPKIHKRLKIHDNDIIFMGHLGNRLEIKFDNEEEMNDDALSDLAEGLSLGKPHKISRDELYETNRY
ncbi:MAG: AbrB/MazE/SpoVT family DNA-binding domain-containing protein [Candidatus Helarchaeota archaeon]